MSRNHPFFGLVAVLVVAGAMSGCAAYSPAYNVPVYNYSPSGYAYSPDYPYGPGSAVGGLLGWGGAWGGWRDHDHVRDQRARGGWRDHDHDRDQRAWGGWHGQDGHHAARPETTRPEANRPVAGGPGQHPPNKCFHGVGYFGGGC
jgi:hypothetical protein